MNSRWIAAFVLLAVTMLFPLAGLAVDAPVDDAHAHGPSLGAVLPLWTVGPFALLLLLIAVMPLAHGHWWEHNTNKGYVVAPLILLVAGYLLAVHGSHGMHEIVEKLKEYFSFMVLLGSLYIISGGIYVKGSLPGTPAANTILMALGAVLASVIGTTGASVLLIRPLLRANKSREKKAHIVVFFIFIVSNCGGLLTPLGDPPLFLGFLKGVPFAWTLLHLWPQWLFVNLALLIIFQMVDSYIFNREEVARPGSQLEEVMHHEPVGVLGGLNFLFLAGIVAVIIASGRGVGTGGKPWSESAYGLQELLMILLSAAAWFTTSRENREQNKFTFGPIVEVAVLFIGIFVTMAPALQILNAWGNHARPDLPPFGLSEPWHYFWITGALSSFLDNAPTYLTFAATASGSYGVPAEGAEYLKEFLAASKPGAPSTQSLLAAISAGAVFMGANTYIGNGPNFMVKAIAEENGVKMPSFFGYMAYSGAILIPIFIVVTLIFFRS
jgi:Na+/H+ antiporter NhaD/arsenite permease-like protein